RTPNVVEPELRTIVDMANNHTMEELLQAPTEGYGETIVISEIDADNYEIKTNMPQLDLVNKFVNQFFPPSKTTHLKNEISRFTQRFEETFAEAWDRFKEMLRACPHHGFTELAQIDTFYNGLNDNDQDSLNVAAGGNHLCKTTREALQIIENKSKVRYLRNKPNVSRMNTTSRENDSNSDDRIDKLADQISTLVDIFAKKVLTPTLVKVVEESCVTCGRSHAYYNCPNTDSNEPIVCVATGTYNQVAPQNRASNYMAPLGFAPNQSLTSGTLSSNTIPNPKGEMKEITTRSDVAYKGPLIPTPKMVVERETEETTDKEQSNFHGSTAHIQPSVTLILKLDVQKTFADALLLMPKFASTIKSLLTNKDTLFDLAKIPLNENCSAMLLKKLPEKLRDPSKFLIPCGNPTSTFEPSLSDSSLSLTPFEGSDFILEEIDAYLKDESISSEIDHVDLVMAKSSIEGPPKLELKDLPSHLEYAYLEGVDKLPVIISKDLKVDEKEALLKVLKCHKRATAWKITDIKGINPRFCIHKILMEEDYKPAVQSQRRVNPKIHEKGRITVVENKNNELIPTRLVTGWRVCIDYKKLNDATRKDHFPLPFMDQMLERLAGNEFYCFLDGFFGYFQILINPPDQEKTTFTCPYGTLAYRRMPFGLCNVPRTFQRCMMAIFHDMIEKTMEIFTDDFLVFGDSFSSCLSYLDTMLQRCEDTNVVLNWEKCHFMVKERIVLGHKISKNKLEVNRSKVDVIAKLPYPTTVKGVRSFLGHAGFYQRFIQDFSKISRPMTHLLEKETPFLFYKECIDAFETLKK
nr:reverse transcriptase domain-containing protein [Tanacetum cinerariifolium]